MMTMHTQASNTHIQAYLFWQMKCKASHSHPATFYFGRYKQTKST